MSDIKKYEVKAPYLNLHASLGEGPFWEKTKDTLRFVDIIKRKLHFVNLSAGPSSLETWDQDFSIGTTADIEGNDDEFVFGGKLGYGIMNRSTRESRWVAKMWSDDERRQDGGGKEGKGGSREERMRSNDGAVDVNGRYFVGAMNDPMVVDIGDEGKSPQPNDRLQAEVC